MEVRTIEEQNAEMADFLSQFPALEKRNLDQTLTDLEQNVNAIRSLLESKPKRVTMKQLNEKLDLILKMLIKNGLGYKDEELQS